MPKILHKILINKIFIFKFSNNYFIERINSLLGLNLWLKSEKNIIFVIDFH